MDEKVWQGTFFSMASLSQDRRYRYDLTRVWNPLKPNVMFIGLNPSTADETLDDPTIRRCMRFAADWGYGGIVMTNLFAFRATDPSDMRKEANPVGPMNDAWLCQHSKECPLVVAAWGCQGAHQGRDRAIRQMIPNLHYLRLTKDGHPGHPLYLPKTLRPVEWRAK